MSYESELDRFVREMRAGDPQMVEQQVRNRATWWDHPQDLEVQRERTDSEVAQPSYVYFPLPKVPNPPVIVQKPSGADVGTPAAAGQSLGQPNQAGGKSESTPSRPA